MGYRTYIGSIPKREYNKIKSLSPTGLADFYRNRVDLTYDDSYVPLYEITSKLYEFGKYVDFNPPPKSTQSFFKNKETKERYEHYDPLVVKKEFLEYAINVYTEKIKTYYNNMCVPFLNKSNNYSDFLNSYKISYNGGDRNISYDFSIITQEQVNALHNILNHIRDFRSEWVDLIPYDLNKGDEVTDSWKYEYSIFELVRIYKHFDWKKNIMILYGY